MAAPALIHFLAPPQDDLPQPQPRAAALQAAPFQSREGALLPELASHTTTNAAEVSKHSKVQRAPPPGSDIWSIHGMQFRIPPLHDQLHTLKSEPQPPLAGFQSYAQWARSFRPPAASTSSTNSRCGGSGRSMTSNSSSKPSAAAAAGGEEEPEDKMAEELREELERWRRCWSVVVRRDIARQQRALSSQQREMLAVLKRSALAAQKEVRKRALNAQRAAASSQVQLRCKQLVKEMSATQHEREAALEAARKETARSAWRVQAAQHRISDDQEHKQQRFHRRCTVDAIVIRVRPSALQQRHVEQRQQRLLELPATVADASAAQLLPQLTLLLELRAIGVHPRLVAPPAGPFVMPPAALVAQGRANRPSVMVTLSAVPADASPLELSLPEPALLISAPLSVWACRQAMPTWLPAIGGALDAVHSARLLHLPTRLLVLQRQLARDVQSAADYWSAPPPVWAALLPSAPETTGPQNRLLLLRPDATPIEGALRDLASCFAQLSRALDIARPGALAAPPSPAVLSAVTGDPQQLKLLPIRTIRRYCARPASPAPFAPPTLSSASPPQAVEAASCHELEYPRATPATVAQSSAAGCMLPSLDTRSLIAASPKLEALDQLLLGLRARAAAARPARSATSSHSGSPQSPGSTVLIFCAMPAALPLLERVLAFRRIPLVPHAMGTAPSACSASGAPSRSVRASATRQATCSSGSGARPSVAPMGVVLVPCTAQPSARPVAAKDLARSLGNLLAAVFFDVDASTHSAKRVLARALGSPSGAACSPPTVVPPVFFIATGSANVTLGTVRTPHNNPAGQVSPSAHTTADGGAGRASPLASSSRGEGAQGNRSGGATENHLLRMASTVAARLGGCACRYGDSAPPVSVEERILWLQLSGSTHGGVTAEGVPADGLLDGAVAENEPEELLLRHSAYLVQAERARVSQLCKAREHLPPKAASKRVASPPVGPAGAGPASKRPKLDE